MPGAKLPYSTTVTGALSFPSTMSPASDTTAGGGALELDVALLTDVPVEAGVVP
jgi:hypothetical protein